MSPEEFANSLLNSTDLEKSLQVAMNDDALTTAMADWGAGEVTRKFKALHARQDIKGTPAEKAVDALEKAVRAKSGETDDPSGDRVSSREAKKLFREDPVFIEATRMAKSIPLSQGLRRDLAETITAGLKEDGREFYTSIVCPTVLGTEVADQEYTDALARLKRLRRAVLGHSDREFEARGVQLADDLPRCSPVLRHKKRLPASLETQTTGAPENFVFDGATNEFWWLDDQQLEWEGPFSEKAYTHRVLAMGVPRKGIDGHRSRVPFVYGSTLSCGDEPIVDRSGLPYRNIFTRSDIEPRPGTWPNIYFVLKNLVGGNSEHLDYVLDWLAKPLQAIMLSKKPGRSRKAVVLHGLEGAGKGLLERILRRIYGRWAVAKIVQKDLEGNFNSILQNKLFVVANEVMSSDNRGPAAANRLKEWIADDTIAIEGKHQHAKEVEAYFNMLITSNDERPVSISNQFERHYTVFRTGGMLPDEIGQAVASDVDGPGDEVSAFLCHLLSREVRKWPQIYNTAARDEIRELSASSPEKFAETIRREGFITVARAWAEDQHWPSNGPQPEAVIKGKWIATFRMLDVYRCFCKRYNLRMVSDEKRLSRILRETFPAAKVTSSRGKEWPGGKGDAWHGIPMNPASAVADTPASLREEAAALAQEAATLAQEAEKCEKQGNTSSVIPLVPRSLGDNADFSKEAAP